MENNTITVAIMDDFENTVDATKTYTLKEIKDILSSIYKKNTNKKENTNKQKLDKNGNTKPKRKPSKYNLYIKARVEELKQEDPSSTAIDRMKLAASSWNLLTDEEKSAYKQE
jgi:hypothetical protein